MKNQAVEFLYKPKEGKGVEDPLDHYRIERKLAQAGYFWRSIHLYKCQPVSQKVHFVHKMFDNAREREVHA